MHVNINKILRKRESAGAVGSRKKVLKQKKIEGVRHREKEFKALLVPGLKHN
jgi:hypothetical protein